MFFVLLLLICGLIIWSKVHEYLQVEEKKAKARQSVNKLMSNLKIQMRDFEKTMNGK